MTTTQTSPPLDARNAFGCSTVVFLRLLAVIYAIAFVSAWTQLDGLVGPHGIAPAQAYFAAAHEQLGATAYRAFPSLCWVFGSAGFLSVLCATGTGLAVLLFAGVAPQLCLFLLWAGYLSIVNAGQQFFGFQWDGLLLETTLLAIFVSPWKWLPIWRAEEPPALARLLIWWLLFRLMFFAGVVKLASGDPTWRDLTALTFHYETQPLPTALAWFAHQMPLGWHRFECDAMFAIELGVPWLIFAPRRWRHAAALVLAALMIAIAATGNYTFFNALAIVLCLSCIDDAAWRWLWRQVLRRAMTASGNAEVAPVQPRRPLWQRYALNAFATFTIGYTGAAALMTLGSGLGTPPGFETIARYVDPLRTFNRYGLFAVMTHPRPELIIEGSTDGREWKAYEFPAKPGALDARPTFVAPHQPRLDWQLWFAALGEPSQNSWVLSLCEHLLRGTPEVLGLVAKNPFPNNSPRYVRVLRYEYHFTDATTRARSGNWWRRSLMDVYIPPVSLR